MDDMEKWLLQYPKIASVVHAMIIGLKRRHIHGSYAVAKVTIDLLKNVIAHTQWSCARDIMTRLHLLGRVLTTAQPKELVVGNMIRRVLYVIREDYEQSIRTMSADSKIHKSLETLSLQSILNPSQQTDYSVKLTALKETVLEGIAELEEELNSLYDTIADQALEHIHANEVILTYGYSRVVYEFLVKAASKHRMFTVIVVEGAPALDGQKMARCLSLAKIDTTLVTDGAIFAMMARVNKVVISASKVVANGGLIASTGIYNVALAAKEVSVPLVCLAGLFKLTPLYPNDLDAFNDLIAPGPVLKYQDTTTKHLDMITAVNPLFDYIPPELVDLFITNNGGHDPSYIYRLLADHYSQEDYDFFG